MYFTLYNKWFKNEQEDRWVKGAATTEYMRIHLPGTVIKMGTKANQLMVGSA